jgi:diguanylate cyclase (GGDEF)-like protein
MFATLFKYELFDLIPLAYSQLFDGMDYPVLVLADSLSVVKANEAAIRMLPMLGKHRGYLPFNSLFPDDPGLSEKLMENEERLVEIDRDEQKRFYAAKLTRLHIKQNALKKDFGYIVVFTDVTNHINIVRDLEIEASTDSLTGLLNRRTFFTMADMLLNEAIKEGSDTSLIMIDIDHFKDVNDRYGHQAGDHVLREVSRIISSQIRGKDIIARYGGEEFVILLPSITSEAAISAANRICAAIRLYDLNAEGSIIHLTVSIGVTSTNDQNHLEINKMIFNADKALYDAKQVGRDRVCFRAAKE